MMRNSNLQESERLLKVNQLKEAMRDELKPLVEGSHVNTHSYVVCAPKGCDWEDRGLVKLFVHRRPYVHRCL